MSLFNRNKDKKKFSETKLGGFLATKAPKILEAVADYVPGGPLLNIAADLLEKDPMLDSNDKAIALAMVAAEKQELETEDKKYRSTRAMLNSKKFRYAVGTLFTILLVQFTSLSPEQAQLISYAVLAVGLTLIGGQGLADFGKEAKAKNE